MRIKGEKDDAGASIEGERGKDFDSVAYNERLTTCAHTHTHIGIEIHIEESSKKHEYIIINK